MPISFHSLTLFNIKALKKKKLRIAAELHIISSR